MLILGALYILFRDHKPVEWTYPPSSDLEIEGMMRQSSSLMLRDDSMGFTPVSYQGVDRSPIKRRIEIRIVSDAARAKAMPCPDCGELIVVWGKSDGTAVSIMHTGYPFEIRPPYNPEKNEDDELPVPRTETIQFDWVDPLEGGTLATGSFED